MTHVTRRNCLTEIALSDDSCPNPSATNTNRASFPSIHMPGHARTEPVLVGEFPVERAGIRVRLLGPPGALDSACGPVLALRGIQDASEHVGGAPDPSADPKRAHEGSKALHACSHCGAALHGRAHRRFCSLRCRVAAHRARRGGAS